MNRGNPFLEEPPPEYGPQYEDHQLIDVVESHVVRQPPNSLTTRFCRISSKSIVDTYPSILMSLREDPFSEAHENRGVKESYR